MAEGKMVILVDDEDRENEGDICMAADAVTPEAINFMAVHARGLICLTLTEEKIAELGLKMMVEQNTSQFETGFTVSIEAREGVTTGISAQDRAQTIRTAVRSDCRPDDLVTPGHVFPIRARRGGVLVRTGQTEGSVDLARLAGRTPAGVICEIMNDDGTMARRPELEAFAQRHGLLITSVRALIEYRLAKDSLIETVVRRKVSTRDWGDIEVMVVRSVVDGIEHLVLRKGEIRPDEPTLVRVQSINLPSDLVGLALSGGGAEMQAAMRVIAEAGSGVFVYLTHSDGQRSMADRLEGVDEARRPSSYHRVGARMDLREFGIGAQILKAAGVRRFRLLSNHDVRIVGLEGFDLELVERVPMPAAPQWMEEA